MKKKLIATLLLVTLSMTTALTGCGSSDKETAGDNVSSGVESNDNTTVNNDTDSNENNDTTKEDTQKIEYSKDDVIVEIGGVSFSMYDTWENIEPMLQNAGIQTVDEYGEPVITFADNEAKDLYIEFFLWDTEECTYIKSIQFCESSGDKTSRNLMKINGYSLNSLLDMAEEYQLEQNENDSSKYIGYVTEEVKVSIDTELEKTYGGSPSVMGDIRRDDLKR